MARYYFDIHNSQFSSIDEDGVDCTDSDSVTKQALKLLCVIAKDEPLLHMHGSLGAVVRDASDHVVLTATVSMSATWVGDA